MKPREDQVALLVARGLTRVQAEIALALAQGMTVREIASARRCHFNAVQYHITKIARHHGRLGERPRRCVLRLVDAARGNND